MTHEIDEITKRAVVEVIRECALRDDISEVGAFILMSAANHLWPNPMTSVFFECKYFAEQEAGKIIQNSSVELV